MPRLQIPARLPMTTPIRPGSRGGLAARAIIAVLCLGLTGPATAAGKPSQGRAGAFLAMAREIVSGIEGNRPSAQALGFLRREYDYVPSKRLRIAVAPFEQDDIKIAKAVADEFNASLFAALLQVGGGRHELVARSHLKGLIEDMRQTGAW
ncbi:MAG: hypothetical protein VCD66_07670 [Alphaproteobacteria bacterium]